MKFFCAPVIILLLCVLCCQAQKVMLKNYNDQNGLPSSEVYYVFEDHEGFIWFATDNGVVRFDGGEFKLFNKSNGLTDAVVFSIIEDPKHNLWFRTFSSAFSVYKNGQVSAYPYNDLVKSVRGSAEIKSLVVDSLGQVFIVGNQNGGFKISIDGKLDSLKHRQDALEISEITKDNFLIHQVKDGHPLRTVYFEERAYRLDSVEKQSISFYFCKRWRGQMYLSRSRQLFRLEGGKAKLVFTAGEPIISLTVDNQDNFWVGLLAKGALRFSEGSFQHPWEMNELKGKSVTSILQDQSGGFWFSTLEKGVYYCPSLKILGYDLLEDSKSSFALSDGDNLIIGFYNGALISIDKKTRKTKWSTNLGKPIVAGAFLKRDHLLLISTSHESFLLNERGVALPRASLDESTKFISKKFFKTKDRIWGVNIYGVLEFDLNGKLLSFHKLDFWCRNILVKGNDIYLAGITGLYKTDSTFTRVAEMKPFANDKISDFALLPSNKILVATVGNGLKIIDGENVKSFSKESGLVFESIYSMAVDSSLWIATEKGLLKVDMDSLLLKTEIEFDLLDRNSGLMSNKINFVIRSEGETWCVYNNGFSAFSDREIHYAKKKPIPRLNGIKVNSKRVDLSHGLDLPFDENNIVLDFGFLSFNNRNIFLRHRAKHTNPWNYTEDFVVNYYSLAPGDYQFEVEYSTDGLVWQKISFPNHATVRPVWSQTIYFRVAILLISAFIFFIYFRSKYKARLLKLQLAEKLKLELAEKLKIEKERIAQDLHDNIGSKLVSLSLGLNHVVKEYDIAPDTANMIYSNVNTTVLELRDTIWAIQKEGITIAEFCDKIKNLVWRLRQNNGSVQYDLQIKTEKEDHVLKPTQAISLYRIVQESIANSQKHSAATSVMIKICHQLTNDLLSIQVEDNGRGFTVKTSTSDESYGLKNMKARAAEVNASFEIQSIVGGGTRVLTSLPLSG